MNADIAAITSGKLDPETKVPRLEARVPLTSLDDYEAFGELDSYQALGITAVPFGATSEGHAEGVVARDVGNQDGVILGARDKRCANVYANMKPGSTVVHSTETGAKAQVRCDPDGQVSVIVTDENGDTAVIFLDGKNNKFQVAAFGGWIEMSEENGIVFTAPGGKATITLKGEAITFSAKSVLLAGNTSTLPVLIGATNGVPTAAGVFA